MSNSCSQPAVADYKQFLEPDKKDVLPASFTLPFSASAAPLLTNPAPIDDNAKKVDTVLHLRWSNLEEFVKWKLEEEEISAVKLVSGLSHTRAYAYALRTKSIVYTCYRNFVVEGKSSCPCFLRVQLLPGTGEVTGQYNNRHSHEISPGREAKKNATSEGINSSTIDEEAKPVTDQVNDKDSLGWIIDHLDQYSLDIANSVAILELKKMASTPQATDVSLANTDLLPNRNIPKHNWGFYGHPNSSKVDTDTVSSSITSSVPEEVATETFNSIFGSLSGPDSDLNEAFPAESTESNDTPVSSSSPPSSILFDKPVSDVSSTSSDLNSISPSSQDATDTQLLSCQPQPLGNHNVQRSWWKTWTGIPLESATGGNENATQSESAACTGKRKSIDDADSINEDQEDKRVRNVWQQFAPSDSSAFYGDLGSFSQTGDSWLPYALTNVLGGTNHDEDLGQWIVPASNSTTGGEAVACAPRAWPGDAYSWGNAPWEKTFNAISEEDLYRYMYTSQDAPQDNFSIGVDDLEYGGERVEFELPADSANDYLTALPFSGNDSDASLFYYYT